MDARGFTLIEFIVVIILIGIITAVASPMLSTGLSGYLTSKNVTNADWQGLLALERMSRDMLEIRSSSDISSATSSTLTFVNIAGTTITYTLSGSTLTYNGQVLADGISNLTFSYFTKSGASTTTASAIRYIQVALTITENGANYSITTSVYPRNLF